RRSRVRNASIVSNRQGISPSVGPYNSTEVEHRIGCTWNISPVQAPLELQRRGAVNLRSKLNVCSMGRADRGGLREYLRSTHHRQRGNRAEYRAEGVRDPCLKLSRILC